MAENQLGVKTRAMLDTEHREGENQKDTEHQQMQMNQEAITDQQQHPHNPDNQGTIQNPTVELTRIDVDDMEEFVRRHSVIGLNWNVPNLINSRVIDLIRNRVPINPGENKVLFNSPELSEFFTRSCCELDLMTGQVHTYSMAAEDIGVACQQEEFDIATLREHFEGQSDQAELSANELKRIPLIKKRAPTADITDLKEIEEKIGQYCQLWELYPKVSCELTRRSKISQHEAANACKVYGPYIRDIMQKFDKVTTLFMMEKELRGLKDRGHFPLPTITPQGTKIENHHQAKKFLEAVDDELVIIANTIRESEKAYEKGQEAAKQQARTTRSAQRIDYNFLSLNSSTPIKNTSTTENRQQLPERTTYFNPNPIHHFYPMTEPTSRTNRYKPPVNDSIIQGTGAAPVTQFTTGTTVSTGRNEPWRNTSTNAASQQIFPTHTTTMTDCSRLFNDSPNSSNNRNAPMCFRYGEQGHMRNECVNRVFCSNCKSGNHSNRTCRKLRSNAPSPTNSHIPTGYHPTATPPPLNEQNPAAQPTGTTSNRLWFQNHHDLNQPRTSTMVHTPPTNNMSPAHAANMTETFTQLLTQAVTNSKGDGTKQMMKKSKLLMEQQS